MWCFSLRRKAKRGSIEEGCVVERGEVEDIVVLV